MATITSPIMTDTTGQDIKDSLDALALAVKPNANNIPYSNTSSGLIATEVQSAIDEVLTKENNYYTNKSLPSGVSVDNMRGTTTSGSLTYNGVYWLSSSQWSGMPIGSYGFLEVHGNLQRFTPYGASGRGESYQRFYANSTWTPWKPTTGSTICEITRASGVSSSVPLPGLSRRGSVVVIHFATLLPAGTYNNLYKVTPIPSEQQHAVVSFNNSTYSMTVLSDGTVKFNNSVTTSGAQYIIGQLVYLTNEI